MTYSMKPLGCDPARIKGMSERLIVSHYENNYGGAVKRLNLIEEQLAEIDYAAAPVFLVNGLKREQLIAMNSMILHELFFDGLGDAERTGSGASRRAGARLRLLRALALRVHRDGQGARRRLRLGAAHLVAARSQAGQSVGLGPLPHAGRRARRSWRSTCTSTPITSTSAPRPPAMSKPSCRRSAGQTRAACSANWRTDAGRSSGR